MSWSGVIAAARRIVGGGSSATITVAGNWESPITGTVSYVVQAPGGPAGARRSSGAGGNGGSGEKRVGTFEAVAGQLYPMDPGVMGLGGNQAVNAGTPTTLSTDATIKTPGGGADIARAVKGGHGTGGPSGVQGAGGTGGTGGVGTNGSPGVAGVGGGASPYPAAGGVIANPGGAGGNPGGGGATGLSGTGQAGGNAGPGRIDLSW